VSRASGNSDTSGITICGVCRARTVFADSTCAPSKAPPSRLTRTQFVMSFSVE
jgi:hypothetical protein